MPFRQLPTSAAWQHRGARDGFETVFPSPEGTGWRLTGCTAAVEDGQAWAVRYAIVLDANWHTRSARIWASSVAGEREVRLDADGLGHWLVDGVDRHDLEGCFDVDLESSACTNLLPIHRLRLDVGAQAEAPAAYVRALSLEVHRLEQTYRRVDHDELRQRFHYSAPLFEFAAELVFDDAGLVLDYPGIARRVA